MIKVAFIDLDGVIANPEARFAKAEEAKQAFLQEAGTRFQTVLHEGTTNREASNVYWRTVFTPGLVALDTVIDGVDEALIALEEAGYSVIFLSSRPEPMREATTQWLVDNAVRILAPGQLILKPSVAQYTKTVLWKAIVVHTVAAFLCASEVLVVDDEQANLDAIWREDCPYTLKCYRSLLEETPPPEDENPF